MFKGYYLRLRTSVFAKNAFILTGGTVIAQALPVITYPILGRIFTPAEFGLLATITAITPLITILASGMYEQAILVAPSKQEAANVVGLILLRSLVVLIACFLLALLFSDRLATLLKEPRLEQWLIVPPLCAFATVIYNCFNEWCISNKKFASLSFNKIVNTSSISGFKVGFGIFRIYGNGLVLGDLFGRIVSASVCVAHAWRMDSEVLLQIRISSFRMLARKYQNFPRYLMPDQILNNIGGSIHIFFIGAYFSNYELGLVSMSASLLTVPVTIISSAIKDVFRQRANEEFVTTGSCRKTYLKLIKPIAVIGILAVIPAYFVIPHIFTIFLGSQWEMAGTYSQILLPMYLLNFISMSLGGVLIIVDKTKVSLYWQIFTIVATVIAFIIGIFEFGTMIATMYLYMIARTASYLLYIILSFRYSEGVRA